MIQITAYLRTEEDLVKWKAIENKTEWMHNHLNNGRMPFLEAQRIPEIVRIKWEEANQALNEAKVPTANRAGIDADGTIFETGQNKPEGENDFYSDLDLEKNTGKVWNRVTKEEEPEVDKAMIDELIRRNQVV